MASRDGSHRRSDFKKISIFETSQKRFKESQRIRKDEREKTFAIKRQKVNEKNSNDDFSHLSLYVADVVRNILEVSEKLKLQMKEEKDIEKNISSSSSSSSFSSFTCMNKNITCVINENNSCMNDSYSKTLLLNFKYLRILFSLSASNVQEALNNGCIDALKICLEGGLKYANEDVLYECVWCIGNIALMSRELPTKFIDTLLISLNDLLLYEGSMRLKEHTAWAFGNLSADFANQINLSSTLNIALQLLLRYGNELSSETAGLLRTLAWLLSNLFRLLNESIAYRAVDEWNAVPILTNLVKVAGSLVKNNTFSPSALSSTYSASTSICNFSSSPFFAASSFVASSFALSSSPLPSSCAYVSLSSSSLPSPVFRGGSTVCEQNRSQIDNNISNKGGNNIINIAENDIKNNNNKICGTPYADTSSQSCNISSSLSFTSNLSNIKYNVNENNYDDENRDNYSVATLNVTDDRRGAAGEALWAVVYLVSVHERIAIEFFREGILNPVLILIQDAIRFSKNFNNQKNSETFHIDEKEENKRCMIKNESNILGNIDIIIEEKEERDLLGRDRRDVNIPDYSKSSIFCSDFELTQNLMSTGVDILVPALNIISYMTGASLTPENYFISELLISSKNFKELLYVLLTYHHRGVVCDAAVIAGHLAAGSQLCTDFVFPLVPMIAKLLESPGSFDIKREAAIGIVHICLNHEHVYLREILKNDNAILDNMISLLEECKYDRTTVIVALDFVEAVAQFLPNGKQMLYAKGIIDKMEGAQFSHDEFVERRIGLMVEKYFDELDEDNFDDT